MAGSFKSRHRKAPQATGDGTGHTYLVPQMAAASVAIAKLCGRLRAYPRTAGDCPNFAQSSEQNGTVPFSDAVFG
jgi:hypothetical protein